MKILEDGRVWLEAGEVIPVWCDCGKIYQPAADSYSSDCPGCRRRNIHPAQRVDIARPN